MPKYYDFKVCGYYLYFTAQCIVEAMHVHASDSKLTESASAKFFVREDGSTVVKDRGMLKDIEIRRIQTFIGENYVDMYKTWSALSTEGYYRNN